MIFAKKFSFIKQYQPFKKGQIEHLDRFFENTDKTGLTFSLKNRTGALAEVLQIFHNYNIDLSYIASKPKKLNRNAHVHYEFSIDAKCHEDDARLLRSIEEIQSIAKKINFSKVENVPWFPNSRLELNKIGRLISTSGNGLESDHPGFNDEEYKCRRKYISDKSNEFVFGVDKFPNIDYTDDENNLWKSLWDKLLPIQQQFACKEFLESFEELTKECEFKRDRIPQIQELNEYLKKRTHFVYRPVAGLLTQREFLNGLAFRVFHSTQYIRHHTKPDYTPEPDIVHEFLGHLPLFGNKDFADFSQEIGLASLGASDEEVRKLGDIYWFSVEFGLVKEKNKRKIYGAGILSSVEEIKWAMSDKPCVKPFDLAIMANHPYIITEVQKTFFEADGFGEMSRSIKDYVDNMKREFNVSYDLKNDTLEIDRRIKTRKESSIPTGEKLF